MKKKLGKLKGQIIGEFDGITIIATPCKAKKSGRDRIWIQIRQLDGAKRWRISESLSYRRGADIEFEHAPNIAFTEIPRPEAV